MLFDYFYLFPFTDGEVSKILYKSKMLSINLITIATILFLIAHDVLILNEEILILICFTTFCLVVTYKFGPSIGNNLKHDINTIKKGYENSFHNLENSLDRIQTEKKHTLKSFFDFKLLGLYYLNLINYVVDLQIMKSTKLIKTPSPKKLIFIQYTESQTRRLVPLFIKKQLNCIISIKSFYIKTIPVTKFLCSFKIALREYVYLVKT